MADDTMTINAGDPTAGQTYDDGDGNDTLALHFAVIGRNRLSGEEETCECANLFIFAGADPATDWLKGCGVSVDTAGFVLTGEGAGRDRGRCFSRPCPAPTRSATCAPDR